MHVTCLPFRACPHTYLPIPYARPQAGVDNTVVLPFPYLPLSVFFNLNDIWSADGQPPPGVDNPPHGGSDRCGRILVQFLKFEQCSCPITEIQTVFLYNS